jgi:histidyl-tRNA synthetase
MSVHLAKGTRDLLPDAMRNRMAVMRTIQGVFERFGFLPLQTPALERIDTLTGKYGDEGEKLMFRILARGDGGDRGEVDLGLRYDLTVPLARVIAMHPELRLPFKRWQMAPVWRAERPQRGRFREFYQCDADIAGTTSPLADAECVAVAATALTELGFTSFTVRLNDRRILAAMARAVGAQDRETGFLIAIDKLDKIGRDGVTGELTKLGLEPDAITRLWAILDLPRGHGETLDALATLLAGDEAGCQGVETLREVLALAIAMGVDPARVAIDPTLARGLNYYTGPVFEVQASEQIGSVSGGGRYDGLVGVFSGRTVPCVGVSLGMERIITVMEEQGMLPASTPPADVLVCVQAPEARAWACTVAARLRAAGVRAELFLDAKKLGAQMNYANLSGHPWVAIVGKGEADASTLNLKEMSTGEQHTLTPEEAGRRIQGR